MEVRGALLQFLTCMCITCATVGVAETVFGIVSGEVKSIRQDGTLEIDSGESIELWGLHLVNLQSSRDLLIGNRVVCSVVGMMDSIYLSDCVITPTKNEPISSFYDLDLFVWLYELSLATRECSTLEMRFSGTRHFNGSIYSCTAENGPQRSLGDLRIE